MYREQIRKLEILIEDQNKQIDVLREDPDKDQEQFLALTEQRSVNSRELSRLRKLQWEEDHERVRFEDDR